MQTHGDRQKKPQNKNKTPKPQILRKVVRQRQSQGSGETLPPSLQKRLAPLRGSQAGNTSCFSSMTLVALPEPRNQILCGPPELRQLGLYSVSARPSRDPVGPWSPLLGRLTPASSLRSPSTAQRDARCPACLLSALKAF